MANGVHFACVCVDALYGRNAALRQHMDERAITYCADIPANARLFAGKPAMSARPSESDAATEPENRAKARQSSGNARRAAKNQIEIPK